MRTLRALFLGVAVLVVSPLIATRLDAGEGLRIEKAVCGAKDSWRDVTAFLQDYVRGNTLAVDISQPFQEIGGDPAPSDGKKLLIDYRLNGASYRLSLEEAYPVAFRITLPSAEAVPPGNDPLPSAESVAPRAGPRGSPSMAAITANLASYVTSVSPGWSLCLSFFACGVSLVSLVAVAVALAQVRGIKKQLKSWNGAESDRQKDCPPSFHFT
jgi:hypothetical protein